MGADMVLVSVWYQKGQKLDWDAGREFIRKNAKKCFEGRKLNRLDMCEDADEVEEHLLESLKDLEQAVTGRHRQADFLEFGNTTVLQSGGMSWGDAPTELYDSICDLYDLDGVLEAVGFNLPEPDWREIMNKILKVRGILPMLIGLDEELDGLVEEALKGKNRK